MDFLKQLLELITQFFNDKAIVKLPTGSEIVEKFVEISAVPAQGDVGTHVAEFQKALNKHGAKLTIDSDFGKKTKAATSAFQKSKGLQGSGIVGPATLRFLGLKVVPTIPKTGAATITSDLKGKHARHLHPEMRAELESRVFPGGVIPQHWKDKDVTKCAIDVGNAMLGMHIREEGGNNKGKIVGWIQSVIGVFKSTGTGDAWCKSAMQCITAFLEDYFQVESPVLASEHCLTVNNAAKKIAGLWTAACEIGSQFEFQNGKSTSGHTGLVVSIPDSIFMNTVEGNTGDASLADGDGFFKKKRNQKKNGNFTTVGFVRFYPYNKVP